MWKKRILCLVLILCAAAVMTACQKKETFPTTPQQFAEQPAATEPQTEQNVFGEAALPQEDDIDWDTYDPSQEEGGDQEPTGAEAGEDEPTAVPVQKSEYAGATPVLIDPIDKPTPTPLPPLVFTYQKYEAQALRLSFEAPAGWVADESKPDSYTLINPMPGMSYEGRLTITKVGVTKKYGKNDLIKEIKDKVTEIGADYKKIERSNTAGRKFMNADGVYINYKATGEDGVKVAGRIIMAYTNNTLYTLHVSYPQGYGKEYIDGDKNQDSVYDRFRHSVKTITKADN